MYICTKSSYFNADIQELIKKIEFADSKRHETYSNLIKSIIIVLAGLISVLVSLKTKRSSTLYEHNLFIITISLLSLGILLGAIVLYSEVHLWDKYREIRWKQLGERIFDNAEPLQVDYVNPNKFYKICKYVFYLTFFSSLLSLVLYAASVDSF